MKKFNDYVEEVIEFMRDEKGLKLDPPPSVKLDRTPRSRFDPFVPTGRYDFRKDEITLCVSGRQCKDILRTLCHELVHADQYRRDPGGYAAFDKGGTLASNAVLRKYEEEAYKKGNVFFREWTESRG